MKKRFLITLLSALALWQHALHSCAETLTIAISPAVPKPHARYEQVPNPDATKFDAIKNKQQHIMVLASDDTPTRSAAWQAFVDLLSETSGVTLKMVPFASRLDFEIGMSKGAFDLAYLDPLQFLQFKAHPGYNALVKRRAQPLQALIVTTQNSPAASIKDLTNRTIGFPGLLHYDASVIARESLKRLQIDHSAHFMPSSQAVFEAVLAGEVPAGATRIEDLRAQPLDTQQKLRILWETPGYTPYALAAHPRVAFFTINRLQRALVRLDKSERGRDVLQHIFVANGFETASNGDWHDAASIDPTILHQPPP